MLCTMDVYVSFTSYIYIHSKRPFSPMDGSPTLETCLKPHRSISRCTGGHRICWHSLHSACWYVCFQYVQTSHFCTSQLDWEEKNFRDKPPHTKPWDVESMLVVSHGGLPVPIRMLDVRAQFVVDVESGVRQPGPSYLAKIKPQIEKLTAAGLAVPQLGGRPSSSTSSSKSGGSEKGRSSADDEGYL